MRRGPEVSKDPFDKMIAAMMWWQAWYKDNPEYIRAPHYYDAIMKWHENLSLDNEEWCTVVHEICVTPRLGGPKNAEKHAGELPPVPVPPDGVRKQWAGK